MTKPPSLPKNWPNPTQEAMNERPQRIVNIGIEQSFEFCDNKIKTSKYEWWNFLPKFLFEEFNPSTKFANCYFLVIAVLQVVPAITNTNGYPTVLIPLLGVLIMSGVLKAMEDIERHKADKLANNSSAEVFDRRTKTFKHSTWADLQVGDFVRVHSRGLIPADLIVFDVSEPNPELPKGACYVETKSLDGETNLKYRSVLSCVLGKLNTLDALDSFRGKIVMEHPNCLIDHFTGVLEASDVGKVPIFPSNVILRGCVLRSTEYMIGLVVNTGHDVKIMQTKIETKVKSSNLEKLATRQILGVICLLFTVCIVASAGQVVFNNVEEVKNFWYLDWHPNGGAVFIIKFFYSLLLHASFVPVALYVSMAMVRFIQAKFMQNDLDMYYEVTDTPAMVRTMTLNEELGQISHIFSDKTGTLTCNNMNFRKASINSVSYGKGITEIGKAAWKLQGRPIPQEMLDAEELALKNAVPHVSFYCPDFGKDYNDSQIFDSITNLRISVDSTQSKSVQSSTNSANQKEKIRDFYRYLSVCHEIIPERLENGDIKLSAPNPDDEALVCAAGYFGFQFQDRRDRFAIIHDKELDRKFEIEVLYTIPFSSSRKRMSVIVRDIDKKIKIITKGADSMMFSRCDKSLETINSHTQQHVDQYSIEGLRCLVVAVSVIEEENFDSWSKHYDEANTDLNELEKKKKGESNDIETLEDLIERNLQVIGATAIEDRLQDGVPDCIERLSQAGIKVWVLTGDKEETAINIAVACNLLAPAEFMDQIIINSTTAPDAKKTAKILKREVTRYMNENRIDYSKPEEAEESLHHEHELYGLDDIHPLHVGCKPRALVIDGPSLIPIMADEKLRNLLLLFTKCCQSVVCCRVSPDQKREILELVKKNVPGVRTLAVGDGANDVAMISAAHVGVGIKGEEGVQAVNAADFAIGQFRFLTPLILKHGRYNYIRMSNLICYMFYKNIFMSATMFWYNIYNGFSGLKFFTEGAIQFYNLFYTAAPIIMYSTYDQDLHSETVVQHPQLYKLCLSNFYFSDFYVWSWITNAMIESVFCSILPVYLLQNYDYRSGVFASHMELGALVFSVVIIVVNMKMFAIQRNWYVSSLVTILISLALWILIALGVSSVWQVDYNFYKVWNRLLKSGVFWLSIFLLVIAVAVKDLFLASISRVFHYQNFHILQEMEQFDPVRSHRPLNSTDQNDDISKDKHGRVFQMTHTEDR